ncbi:hypothetical protein Pa4123_92150 [Phytohabitans aurantiacus]|uniref:Tetratricopeptide repeat protein n=1 Tax=Phytohabitans aurantiacus TaxID=3016789 RepID=A0ABQ5RB23_9ACTN|nr:hypothetical protein Pa4123_92150 [Phytohabitans aurantiacus]
MALRLQEEQAEAHGIPELLNDLSIVLADEGDLAQAVQLSAEIVQSRLGRGPGVELEADDIRLISNLATMLADSGRPTDADRIFNVLVDQLSDMRDVDWDSLASTLHNWATVAEELGRAEEAVATHRRVLEIRRRLGAGSDQNVVVSLLGLASALGGLGELDEAREFASQAFETAERVLGEYHACTLVALDLLSGIAFQGRSLTDAFMYGERAFARRRDVLGEENPATVDALHNLAIIAWQAKERRHAEAMVEQVIQAREKTLGPQHPKTIEAVRDLARVRGPASWLSELRRTHRILQDVTDAPEDEQSRLTRLRLFHEPTAVVE